MSRQDSQRGRYDAAHKTFSQLFPQIYSVLDRERDFVSLLVKVRDDGSCIAVLKEFGPDGAKLVCFGSGYGAVGALLGLEGSVAAGHWKVDKPYHEGG